MIITEWGTSAKRNRRCASLASMLFLVIAACSNPTYDLSADDWMNRTRDTVVSAATTLGKPGAERSLIVPFRGDPDPYVVALASIALADRFDSIQEGTQSTIREHLTDALEGELFQGSSVDRLYTAAALLEAGEVTGVYDEDGIATLRRVVVDAIHQAPDYFDHIDAIVALEAVPEGSEGRASLEDTLSTWTTRVEDIVCSPEASRLDYWIAANVPELEVRCLSRLDKATWLRDASATLERLKDADPLDAGVCEEARWLSQAAISPQLGEPDVIAVNETLRVALGERNSLGDLLDPLQCAAAVAALEGPLEDPALVEYLASVAVRGGESAVVRLDSYSLTRFILLTRMLGTDSDLDLAVLHLADDELLALVGAYEDLPVPTTVSRLPADDTTFAEISHVLEAILRDDDVLCPGQEANAWIAFGLERANYDTIEDGVVAAMAIRATQVCDGAPAVDPALHDIVLERADRWRELGVAGQSLGALWAAEAVVCAGDPEALPSRDQRWGWVEPYVDPAGAVYDGRFFSPLDTYFAVSLLTADVGSCVDYGVLDEH